MNDGIRLGGTLRFRDSEKYIEKKVEELNASHRITEFIGYLLRIAFDSPEDFNRTEDLEATLQFMNKHGVTPAFSNYLTDTRKEISSMRDKIDKIYDMCKDMYTMSMLSKSIGLEDKTVNTAKALFMVQKQLDDLTRALGISDYKFISSQDTTQLEEDSARALEYIINRYSNVIDELKQDATEKTTYIAVPNIVNNSIETIKTDVNKESTKETEAETFEDTNNSFDDDLVPEEDEQSEYKDDTIIDFSTDEDEDDDFGSDDMFKKMDTSANLAAYNRLFKKS